MTTDTAAISQRVLEIDPARESEKIRDHIKASLAADLKRRGLVIGISGGIDSTVTAALAVRSLGPKRVILLQMPERHSAEETHQFSDIAASFLGIEPIHEDITGILHAAGFYRRYDEAVRTVIPEYGTGWKSKLVLRGAGDGARYNLFSLVAESPEGEVVTKRLPHQTYLAIVAATNFKQRIRKMLEYYHADRTNYAVAGTPNRLEYDQGFFVKLGDGAADIKPIAHLYKSQVYQLAEYLGVPEEICSRPPTTDTYSLAQGQDEFYFALPYPQMDLCLYAKNNSIPATEIAPIVRLEPEHVERVYRDIDSKRSTTRYLHLPPLLADRVPEVGC
ncbi:MAG: NAD(+) synthase [Chitinivibrionales bacterium]|nr:NAD(+) synthase [Chitinivibrionales bacterium]MBD3355652.1 NAD(+) synthase [Chitinivibrionales bacterium]